LLRRTLSNQFEQTLLVLRSGSIRCYLRRE